MSRTDTGDGACEVVWVDSLRVSMLAASITAPMKLVKSLGSPILMALMWATTRSFTDGQIERGMYALDAASGQLKWKFATANVVHTSPAIADGVVYFGSWDSYFYAVDARTGTEKWRFHGGEDPVAHNQVHVGAILEHQVVEQLERELGELDRILTHLFDLIALFGGDALG